jgi:vacuolar-type H+-ATPase subunit H
MSFAGGYSRVPGLTAGHPGRRVRPDDDTAFAARSGRPVYDGAVPDDAKTPASSNKPNSQRLSAADSVASILSAAEAAAEQIRSETEARARDRIAEGERAAGYRVEAAEEEAAEILASARQEAERLRREAHDLHEQSKTTATSEALTIIANAQQNADETIAQASEQAARSQQEADAYTRDLLSEARMTAQEVRSEGMQLVGNLRQMGDSLRANAERLLRDVAGVHSQMVSQIERAEGAAGRSPSNSGRKRADESRSLARGAFDSQADADLPDVPEFIPRR